MFQTYEVFLQNFFTDLPRFYVFYVLGMLCFFIAYVFFIMKIEIYLSRKKQNHIKKVISYEISLITLLHTEILFYTQEFSFIHRHSLSTLTKWKRISLNSLIFAQVRVATAVLKQPERQTRDGTPRLLHDDRQALRQLGLKRRTCP